MERSVLVVENGRGALEKRNGWGHMKKCALVLAKRAGLVESVIQV